MATTLRAKQARLKMPASLCPKKCGHGQQGSGVCPIQQRIPEN
jgi:hypothetical protein